MNPSPPTSRARKSPLFNPGRTGTEKDQQKERADMAHKEDAHPDRRQKGIGSTGSPKLAWMQERIESGRQKMRSSEEQVQHVREGGHHRDAGATEGVGPGNAGKAIPRIQNRF